MPGFRFIQAADIVSWAERRADAPGQLPILVQKLVIATTPPATFADFPGDKGISSPGWDGWVKNGINPIRYVPPNESVWELSVDKQAFQKASKDFGKRSLYPTSIDLVQTTFVAVTARSWRATKRSDKHAWMASMKKKGIWSNVCAYDAHDLAAWLELAPSVALWLMAQMGLPYPRSVRDLTCIANRFLHGFPPPPLDLEDLLTARTAERDRIHVWLRQAVTSPLIIEASTQDEAASFFAAAVYALPPDERESIDCRALAVTTEEDFLELAESTKGMGLILLAQFPNALTRARYATSSLGHRVVVPIAKSSGGSGEGSIKLGPLPPDVFQKTLRAHGYDDRAIHEMEISTQRDLAVVTRKLTGTPAAWLEKIDTSTLLVMMLVRTWRDSHSGDQAFIAQLSGISYSEFVEKLALWHGQADSPVRKTGDVWRVTGASEILTALAANITQSLITRWQTQTIGVFCSINPKFELKPADRFAAAVHGKTPAHSSELRDGLAAALAILACHPPSRWLAQIQPGDCVNVIGNAICVWADKWDKWASLDENLPLLAEAFPEVFLSSVHNKLDHNPTAITGLFGQESDFSGSPITGLIWALEQFAWEPSYFSRAMLLIARLAELDEGGRWSPRPAETLRRILCFWRPQTNATFEARQSFLKLLESRHPVLAWETLRALMPSSHEVSSDITKPVWRTWHHGWAGEITEAEYWTMVIFGGDELLTLAGNDSARWAELLGDLISLPEAALRAVLDAIAHMDRDRIPLSQRVSIWEKIRQLLHDHRKFRDADWAAPEWVLDKLAQLYESFTPTDPVMLFSWLFGQNPNLPDGGSEDWDSEQKKIDSLRYQAVTALIEAGGLSLIFACVDSVENPWSLGVTFARHPAGIENEREFLFEMLCGGSWSRLRAAHGFMTIRFQEAGGWIWAHENLPAVNESSRLVNYLCGLPFAANTWTIAKEQGTIIENAYWQAVQPRGLPSEPQLAQQAIRSFLIHNRPLMALKLVGPEVRRHGEQLIDASLQLELMESVVKADPEEQPGQANNIAFHIGEILSVLGKAPDLDEDRVARLEFFFIEIFRNNLRSGPNVLHRKMARDPVFFTEVICHSFRARGAPAKQISTEKTRLAKNSYTLLKSWRTIPGRQPDGSTDEGKLREWVVAARAECAKQKRAEVGDAFIGELLAHAPAGSDGLWPIEAVRKIIEEIPSDKLRNSIRIGLFNKRSGGFGFIGVGGLEERKIAAEYRAAAAVLRDKWPQTAALHEAMATSYEHDAVRADREAEEDI